jgi:hypothetical protein
MHLPSTPLQAVGEDCGPSDEVLICLSFDTDHMSELRMAEFLSTNTFFGRGTFFCTQRYQCLAGADHEQCPHPLLEPGSDWERELREKREAFPLAKGWRSHSCVFSHMLAVWLGQHGYEYVSTHDQFGQAGPVPIRSRWGIWHLPIYYTDTMDFSAARFGSRPNEETFDEAIVRKALASPGLYVFDFHPVHIMLNTPDAEYYLARRDRFLAGEPIQDLRHPGYGTASFFAELCANFQRAGLRSLGMHEALIHFLESGVRSQAGQDRRSSKTSM